MIAEISGDEARSLLRRELLDPDYQQETLIQRVLSWIQDLGGALLSTAESLSAPSVIAVVVVVFTLCVLLLLSLGRVRSSASVAARRTEPVLDPSLSADVLLRVAQEARVQGELRVSAVAAFRAAATLQAERGALDPAPGATAREIASALGDLDASVGREFSNAASVFEVALYSRLPVDSVDVDRLIELAQGHRVAAWSSELALQVPR